MMWSMLQFLVAKQCEQDEVVKSKPTTSQSFRNSKGRPKIKELKRGSSGKLLNFITNELTLTLYWRPNRSRPTWNCHGGKSPLVGLIISHCSRTVLWISQRYRRQAWSIKDQAMALKLDKNKSCSGTCPPHQRMGYFSRSSNAVASWIYRTTQLDESDNHPCSQHRICRTACPSTGFVLFLWIAYL